MKLLCADTATRVESVAITEDGVIRAQHSVQRKGGHGADILDDVDDLLSQLGWTLDDLDGFACGLGPGSFTGLRIGLATLKGLAMASGKPLLGARTTELLRAAAPDGPVVAIIDARRNQIYAEGSGLDAPVCCDPDQLWTHLEPVDGMYLVGDGAVQYRDILLAGGPGIVIPEAPELHQPQAGLLATLVDPTNPPALATLEPIYVRKSDAEINYPDGFPDAASRPPKVT